jgi:hypothetical protein
MAAAQNEFAPRAMDQLFAVLATESPPPDRRSLTELIRDVAAVTTWSIQPYIPLLLHCADHTTLSEEREDNWFTIARFCPTLEVTDGDEDFTQLLEAAAEAFQDQRLQPYVYFVLTSLIQKCDAQFLTIMALVVKTVVRDLAENSSAYEDAIEFSRAAVLTAARHGKDCTWFVEAIFPHIVHNLVQMEILCSWPFEMALIEANSEIGIAFAAQWIFSSESDEFEEAARQKVTVIEELLERPVDPFEHSRWSDCTRVLLQCIDKGDTDDQQRALCCIWRIAAKLEITSFS